MYRSKFAVAVVVASSLVAASAPASAQIGQLRGLLPGGRTSAAAAVDPDAFLAETIETTKFMMIAALVLANAEKTDTERDAIRAQIATIQGASDIGELNTHRASFTENAAAIALNYGDETATQAAYDAMTREQQQLMLSAAYNFALGMARNVQLAEQAPQLISSIQSNPMLLRRVGSLRTAAGLLGQQVDATRSMAGTMRTLLSRGGVEVPADAHAAQPRAVEL
ncbi:hypothetical protein KB221_07410 [Aquidulcibacter paucihalophilus]|nr:hypothetical protein KB221_07410 [Aquidulcibacter paucihalophilus]